MQTLVPSGLPAFLLMQGGQFGHGHGDGLGRGFLQRTDEEPERRDGHYKPPRRGCGVNAVSVLALATAILLLGRPT